MAEAAEYTLEFLLEFNGRIHYFDSGYWLKMDIERVEPTEERPHGLRYSFTLHDPDGRRLLGFDNAHAVPPLSSGFAPRPVEYDHRHSSGAAARPYRFVDAATLLGDFFSAVRLLLTEKGVSEDVIGVTEKPTNKGDDP
jgi:hypothetical protein